MSKTDRQSRCKGYPAWTHGPEAGSQPRRSGPWLADGQRRLVAPGSKAGRKRTTDTVRRTAPAGQPRFMDFSEDFDEATEVNPTREDFKRGTPAQWVNGVRVALIARPIRCERLPSPHFISHFHGSRVRHEQVTLSNDRFSELRELLRSYAETGYAFDYTEDHRGAALSAYLRLAAFDPARAAEAAAEIDDLLAVGLFNDEIADDVDLLPHINPPRGKTVESCLAVIGRHLRQFLAEPETPSQSPPQTTWEWRERFPELSHLLGAYFHQDFSLEYSSERDDSTAAGEHPGAAPSSRARWSSAVVHGRRAGGQLLQPGRAAPCIGRPDRGHRCRSRCQAARGVKGSSSSAPGCTTP